MNENSVIAIDRLTGLPYGIEPIPTPENFKPKNEPSLTEVGALPEGAGSKAANGMEQTKVVTNSPVFNGNGAG